MVTPRVGAWPDMPGRCAPIFCETNNSLMNSLLQYRFWLLMPLDFWLDRQSVPATL